MTSIRGPPGDALAAGEPFCLAVEERDGRLVAPQPVDGSPAVVAVLEGLDRLDVGPPDAPIPS